MATMKLYELVNHYHIGTELTCAEAMFMACNEYYHLNLSEETRKMFSVMGLGDADRAVLLRRFHCGGGGSWSDDRQRGPDRCEQHGGYRMIAELTDFSLDSMEHSIVSSCKGWRS